MIEWLTTYYGFLPYWAYIVVALIVGAAIGMAVNS